MTALNGNNGKNGLKPVFLALYFLGVVLSGSGGTYVWLRTTGPEMVAPDRFTGTEAAALKLEINQHIRSHPDQENRFDARITRLEAQYTIILANQARILDRLDR